MDTRSHLLDLIPKDREWLMNIDGGRSQKSSEERELELRLGPPGEDWPTNDGKREREESLFSLGCFTTQKNTNNGCQTPKISTSENPAGAILSSPWGPNRHQGKASQFLQFPTSTQNVPVIGEEASQAATCCPKVVDLQNAEKKSFSPSSANTAVPNSSQKRDVDISSLKLSIIYYESSLSTLPLKSDFTITAPSPVVGWPPIRSFRKNRATSSTSKPSESHQQHAVPDKVTGKKPIENSARGLFVKINMDGVPIGRKVDLNAYDSYEKLSFAVDELFRGLLAAQRDSSAVGIQNKQEEEKVITGLLDGSGEHTLVYEDNEGDRMLAGDVPWHMFVSTVKRLRVLKSSELSALTLGSKQEKITVNSH